tara:strand:- start:329 stop:697 length:369 start_codon:yes stop_codon:yes gene_type:complete
MINFLKKISLFGFGKDGLSHWFWQRITAVSMIFLFAWIIFSLKDLSNNFIENFYIWIKVPLNFFLFISLFIIVVHHSTLGILNIFEDYIESKNRKNFLIFFIKLLSFVLICINVISVCNIQS